MSLTTPAVIQQLQRILSQARVTAADLDAARVLRKTADDYGHNHEVHYIVGLIRARYVQETLSR